MKSKLLLILTLLLLAVPAQAVYVPSLVHLKDPYIKVLRKFSKWGYTYYAENLDAKLIWYATYHSEAFRKAFEEQYNKFYPNGQDGLADRLGHPWDHQPNVEFFISLYAKERGLQKLVGPKNLWDLSLKVGENVYKPTSIDEVSITPFEKTFYPYINPWSRAYRAIFPLAMTQLQGTPFTLQLNSVVGQSQLKFKKKNDE